MLLLIFEKRMNKKNGSKNFKIRKYAFLNIVKRDEQKNSARKLKIPKYAFFNI